MSDRTFLKVEPILEAAREPQTREIRLEHLGAESKSTTHSESKRKQEDG